MKKIMLVFNYLGFQLCWLALLYYQDVGMILFLIFIITHFVLIGKIDSFVHMRLEVATIAVVTLLGLFMDQLLFVSGIYIFDSHQGGFLPFWYILLWPLFAATLHHCFYLFHRLTFIPLGCISAISVPVIYAGAAKTTVKFSLAEPQALSIGIMAVLWFLLLPLLIKLTIILQKHFLTDFETARY